MQVVVVLNNGARYIEAWQGSDDTAIVRQLAQSKGYGLSDVYKASVDGRELNKLNFRY